MIALERQNKIKELLLTLRSVKVADLAEAFSVSNETIRRDLGKLESDGVVQKNHGGAVLSILQPPVSQRKMQLYEEKSCIGRRAMTLVQPKQVVFLDAGSTTWCVARQLKSVSDLTVVTNGINVAEELSQSDNAQIFVIGGKIIMKSMSVVGPQAEAEIHKYSADIAFVGTAGISVGKGFSSSDIYEAEVKKAMVAAANRVVVVADHTKFSRPGLIIFSSFADVDILVTSDLADELVLEQISRLGVEVLVEKMGS